MIGYGSSAYTASLAEFGRSLPLSRSGGHVLVRDIDEAPGLADAIGCYPLFACSNWQALPADLTEAGQGLVTLSLVADPFGNHDQALLRACFPDLVRPFKAHHVVDLETPVGKGVSKHHRYYARQAQKAVDVEICEQPTAFLDEWIGLYAVLAERYRLSGIRAFSRAAFAAQLRMPGMTMIRALRQGSCVSAHLWLAQGEVVHSHLAASSEEGYRHMASYAVYATALEWFRGRARWLNLGAGAGFGQVAGDGLSRFKSGWTPLVRTAWLCGTIFDRPAYARLVEQSGNTTLEFFPAYRAARF